MENRQTAREAFVPQEGGFRPAFLDERARLLIQVSGRDPFLDDLLHIQEQVADDAVGYAHIFDFGGCFDIDHILLRTSQMA